MRKILVIMVCVAMAFSAAACKNMGDAIGEKIVETALGHHVDIDGDKVTITKDDGGKYLFGSGKWPEIPMLKRIPKLDHGKVILTSYAFNYCIITMSNIKEKDFNKYIAKIKAEGFTRNISQQTGDKDRTFSAKDNIGYNIRVTLDVDSEKLGLVLEKIPLDSASY